MCHRHHSLTPAPGARHAGEEIAALGGRCARSLKSYGEVCIMTCREFKHAAASLTLWELSRPQDEQLLDHADACPKCGAWLDSQQMLAATMQTLQDRTAGLRGWPTRGTGAASGVQAGPFRGNATSCGAPFHSSGLALEPLLRGRRLRGCGGSHCGWIVPRSSAAGGAFRGECCAEPVCTGEYGVRAAAAGRNRCNAAKNRTADAQTGSGDGQA